MTIDTLRQSFPDSAKDTKINLSKVLSEDGAPDLMPSQQFATALASAYAVRSEALVQAVLADGADILSEQDIEAAKSAASIMAMNNIYYRFVHLASDKEYGQMPANLRMQVIANPSVEKVEFELYSLAVSAINGCGMCIDAHVAEVTKAGFSKTAVQSAIRIASVINAAAQSLFIAEQQNGAVSQAA